MSQPPWGPAPPPLSNRASPGCTSSQQSSAGPRLSLSHLPPACPLPPRLSARSGPAPSPGCELRRQRCAEPALPCPAVTPAAPPGRACGARWGRAGGRPGRSSPSSARRRRSRARRLPSGLLQRLAPPRGSQHGWYSPLPLHQWKALPKRRALPPPACRRMESAAPGPAGSCSFPGGRH